MKFPYTITTTNITVFVDGQIVKLPSTHTGFRDMVAHLQGDTHDSDVIKKLADKREALARLTAGGVTVMGSTVYYKGAPVRSALSDRLVKLTDEGFDGTPWALFMDKVMQNPSENSKERLFEFLDRWEAPLTPDGDFIAFKGVKEDYSSTRTGPDGKTVYNKPGTVVEMPREEVVEDPNVTCASGLHACASHYLDCFWGTQNKVLALAINPKDVVSIPIDYNLSKMRVCRYEIIGDVEDTRHRDRIEGAQIVDQSASGRVAPVEAAPIDLDNPLPRETFTYQGELYQEAEGDVEDDDIAVSVVTGKVGKVLATYDMSYDDADHPDHDDWLNGYVSGDDTTTAVYVELLTEDSIEELIWQFGDALVTRLELVEDDIDIAVQAEIDANDDILTFEHGPSGRTFSAPQIMQMVDEIGQRGFARKFGVPRTTLQDWIRRAQEAGY